ncbi:spore coat protein CotZ [Bacillus aquiflavi]|uniref:Spore coat protein CotZ n=1 Tax=Bacillus aquiflavi TaxID=2672567 RepID=A0A6B3VUY1_9BACI|nr:CotY/CotZ family spore coat protein [Bacillus aquiflavi]MBA4536414.1 spore coat protein CotZ [Bacillus aquiflavi]NEY80782.1 spore coat protein CotZ [Bacillus aquiflavi]UAC49128.1 spore coat protein CotZ [Bacillus aquiflavi]
MSCGKKPDTHHKEKGCVCEVVRAIKDIQESVVEECPECPTSCFLEPLGALVSPGKKHRVDTRVFILKNADGSPFHAFFKGTSEACVSIFFRVEEIFDTCCATLRVLIPKSSNNEIVNLVSDTNPCCIDLTQVCQVDHFRKSDDCVTVDLNCFCAIQCIADVNLNIC